MKYCLNQCQENVMYLNAPPVASAKSKGHRDFVVNPGCVFLIIR